MSANGIVSQDRSGSTSYYLQDGQGSTRALTNSLGAVTDAYSYTAFGELLNQTGSATNSYLYTGQQFDSLTGLYDLRARYYEPALGRFLSQDMYPVNFNNPVELNRYVYTGNNPINAIDQSGQFAEMTGAYQPARQNTPRVGLLGRLTRVAYARTVITLILLSAPIFAVIGDLIGVEDIVKDLKDVDVKSIEQILAEAQWREWLRLRPNPDPLPEPEARPTPGGTPIPPIITTPTSDNSFDVAFGRDENLGLFALTVGTKYKRTVVPWNEWDQYSLFPTSPDTSLPTKNAIIARRYIGGAETWSMRFPEAQYPQAKIRMNLWRIELGDSPRITLWEYYFLRQKPMLWSRVVFYDWEASGFLQNPSDPMSYPISLEGGSLSSRLLQIESSQNYRKIQTLMGTAAP